MTANKPKPSKDTVYIDADDDVTAIIDKVEATKNKVVALVLPKHTAALHSIVNMRLLKRSAKDASKSVVLITGEDALLPLAGTAGVHVAKNLQSKPAIPAPPEMGSAETEADSEIDNNQAIGELAAAHEAINLDDGEAEKEIPKAKPKKDKSLKVPNFERFRLGMIGTVVLALAFLLLLIFGFFIWPKATIAITTQSTSISANFNIEASNKFQKLDNKAGQIPAALKTTDQSSTTQVDATGKQNNGKKAEGNVTMNGGDCGPIVPNDVPAGTGISTNGLVYITQEDASFNAHISGGHCVFQSNSVKIEAQKGGSNYNTSLNGAAVVGRDGVTADGSASGGTDDITTVLSQADVDSVKQKFSAKKPDQFTKDFESSLKDQGYYVVDQTLDTSNIKVTASPAVGQPASTANVTVKITYSVLVVKKDDLQKAITYQLDKQIDTKKQKISVEDVTKDANVTIQSSASPKDVTLQISEDATAVPMLNIDFIKQQAGGQKSGDIKAFIENYPGVKNVDVKMSPFWVSKAPKKASKIHIILLQSSGSR